MSILGTNRAASTWSPDTLENHGPLPEWKMGAERARGQGSQWRPRERGAGETLIPTSLPFRPPVSWPSRL